MATGKALNGKPCAGNPHARFGEGKTAPSATPRRGALLYTMGRIMAALSFTALHSAACGAVAAVRPSEAHLGYQDREIIALVCWGPNAYTGQEWGFGNVSPAKITANRLDPAQWAGAMRAAEISCVVLVAKHHDGFCLWPSPLNKDYSMSAAPAPNTGRDLVRELADACRARGMKFGVYLSPWDRHQGSYATPAYVDYFFAQWNEVLDNYGEISEIWLDGANGGTGWYGGVNGDKGERRSIPKDYYRLGELLRIMHEKHPLAIAFGGNGAWSSKWCGNESGVCPETWWCPQKGRDGKMHWIPSETDFPLRRGWYWHKDERPKSLARLVKIYYESVGRGSVMDIGIAPDDEGQICADDARRLAEFGEWVRDFSSRDFAKGAKVTESRDGNKLVLEMALPAAAEFNCVDIKEKISVGQRVASFTVEAPAGDGWRVVAHGTPRASNFKVGVRYIGENGDWIYANRFVSRIPEKDRIDTAYRPKADIWRKCEANRKGIIEEKPESRVARNDLKGHHRIWFVCMRERRDTNIPVEATCSSTISCILGYHALNNPGRTIEWDPVNCKFKNPDDEKNLRNCFMRPQFSAIAALKEIRGKANT